MPDQQHPYTRGGGGLLAMLDPPILTSWWKTDQRNATITFDQVTVSECNSEGMALVCWDCTDCGIAEKKHSRASEIKKRDAQMSVQWNKNCSMNNKGKHPKCRKTWCRQETERPFWSSFINTREQKTTWPVQMQSTSRCKFSRCKNIVTATYNSSLWLWKTTSWIYISGWMNLYNVGCFTGFY